MRRRAPCRYDDAAIGRTCECRHGTLDFVGVGHVPRRELNTKGLRYRSNSRELSDTSRRGDTKHQGSGHVGRDLLEQLGPFAAYAVLEIREAREIAAWVGHTFDETSTNRIGNVHEHDWDSTRGLLQRRSRQTAYAKDHVRDRKSRRLNSSHLGISYAVFCLKKKNTNKERDYSMQQYHDISSSFRCTSSYDTNNSTLPVVRTKI